jgi:hypothetical protein
MKQMFRVYLSTTLEMTPKEKGQHPTFEGAKAVAEAWFHKRNPSNSVSSEDDAFILDTEDQLWFLIPEGPTKEDYTWCTEAS